jgi:hypothetical protein
LTKATEMPIRPAVMDRHDIGADGDGTAGWQLDERDMERVADFFSELKSERRRFDFAVIARRAQRRMSRIAKGLRTRRYLHERSRG